MYVLISHSTTYLHTAVVSLRKPHTVISLSQNFVSRQGWAKSYVASEVGWDSLHFIRALGQVKSNTYVHTYVNWQGLVEPSLRPMACKAARDS